MDRYLIGIDVGGTNIKMMLMDDSFHVVEKRSVPTNREIGNDGYERASGRMITELEDMFSANGIHEPEVLYVGMGLPGMVNAKEQRTLNLPFLQWDGFDPSKKIASHFHARGVIENDASVNALGEWFFGENSSDNMILITLGTGVGGGIITEGKIFGGASNYGAELGHMIIDAEGEREFCGRKGCLEAYCSGTAMEQMAKENMDRDPGTILHRLAAENGGRYENKLLSRGCLEGDAVCLRVMDRFTDYLAAGIANLMELFNPELILLGGGVSNAGDLILEPVEEKVRRIVLWEEQRCPIRKASLGSEAGMYGACALAAQKAGLNCELPR